ncbi:MAG: FHA domain-containing protein [Verrucomicrobiota bacterium]
MIELATGESGGARVFEGNRLPLLVGRGQADHILDLPGVWDRHLMLSRDEEGWLMVAPQGEAMVFRGGERIGGATRLRNGDTLELGSVRLRFRISSCRQRPLKILETSAWLILLALAAAQVLLLVRF